MNLIKWLAGHPKLAYVFTWVAAIFSIRFSIENFDRWGIVMMIIGWGGLIIICTIVTFGSSEVE